MLQKGEDKMYGHAGMLGAAAAVWEDLRANHLLAALLDLPLDEDCKPHSEHSKGDKRDLRMSHSEKERHMQWESEDAHSEDPHSSSEQQPAKHAAGAAKGRTKGRPRFMERGQLLRTSFFVLFLVAELFITHVSATHTCNDRTTRAVFSPSEDKQQAK